jgi:hypothetical protein
VNAATRYNHAVDYVVRTVHCWHCVGAGWHARDVDLELQHARAVGRAGYDILVGGIPILDSPSWDELVERRGDDKPCSQKCGQCTRCRISRAYHARRAYQRLAAGAG